MYKRKGVKVIFKSLPKGVCPWVFPLIVEDKDFMKKIKRQGIAGSFWPKLPQEVQGKNDYTNFLAQHLFNLPVHQNINPVFIRRFI